MGRQAEPGGCTMSEIPFQDIRATAPLSAIPDTAPTTIDLAKAAALLLMLVDHTGAFLVPDPETASVLRLFGRLSMPLWALLLGWLATPRVPWRLLSAGLFMSVLMSAQAGGPFVNILLVLFAARALLSCSLAERLLASSWAPAAVILACALGGPVMAGWVEYGTMPVALAVIGRLMRQGRITPLTLGSGLLAVALYAGWQGNLPDTPFPPVLGVQLVGGSLAAMMACGAFFRFKTVPVSGARALILRWTGRHTLILYLAHLTPLVLWDLAAG